MLKGWAFRSVHRAISVVPVEDTCSSQRSHEVLWIRRCHDNSGICALASCNGVCEAVCMNQTSRLLGHETASLYVGQTSSEFWPFPAFSSQFSPRPVLTFRVGSCPKIVSLWIIGSIKCKLRSLIHSDIYPTLSYFDVNAWLEEVGFTIGILTTSVTGQQM